MKYYYIPHHQQALPQGRRGHSVGSMIAGPYGGCYGRRMCCGDVTGGEFVAGLEEGRLAYAAPLFGNLNGKKMAIEWVGHVEQR
eukprot:7390627-Pyramimonas_sp.AAC.2